MLYTLFDVLETKKSLRWDAHFGYSHIYQFNATGLFLYLLKISENQRFPDVFRGHTKRPVA